MGTARVRVLPLHVRSPHSALYEPFCYIRDTLPLVSRNRSAVSVRWVLGRFYALLQRAAPTMGPEEAYYRWLVPDPEAALRAWLGACMQDPVSPAFKQKMLQVADVVCRRVLRLLTHPLDGLRAPPPAPLHERLAPRRRKAFTVRELQRLESVAAPGSLHQLLFSLLRTTGMRVGAVVRLRVGLVARRSESGWAALPYGVVLEKGAKGHTFPLVPTTARLLEPWLNRRPHDAEDYVFAGGTCQGHIGTGTVRRALRMLCHRAQVAEGCPVHPHAFRHAVIRQLHDAGNPLEDIARFVGHRSPHTTAHYYLAEQVGCEALCKRMRIPWLEESHQQAEEVVTAVVCDTNNASTEIEHLRQLLNIYTNTHTSVALGDNTADK